MKKAGLAVAGILAICGAIFSGIVIFNRKNRFMKL